MMSTDCGGCRGLGKHSPRCHTQPGYFWRRRADRAESLADEIGSNDTEMANQLYAVAGECRARAASCAEKTTGWDAHLARVEAAVEHYRTDSFGPRPVGCCGKCPPIAGGGYDCTCEGNPRCGAETNIAEVEERARALARGWLRGRAETTTEAIEDGGHCCTPDSGDCCGPGSWCCTRAGKHEHEEENLGVAYLLGYSAAKNAEATTEDAEAVVVAEFDNAPNKGWDSLTFAQHIVKALAAAGLLATARTTTTQWGVRTDITWPTANEAKARETARNLRSRFSGDVAVVCRELTEWTEVE